MDRMDSGSVRARLGAKVDAGHRGHGKGYQTLRACEVGGEGVRMSRQRGNLSWSHHREVAALPADAGARG
jgi:hypothetical protein